MVTYINSNRVTRYYRQCGILVTVARRRTALRSKQEKGAKSVSADDHRMEKDCSLMAAVCYETYVSLNSCESHSIM